MAKKPNTLEILITQDILQTQGKEYTYPPLWAKFLRNLLWLPLITIVAIFTLESIFRAAHIGEEQIWGLDPSFGFMSHANTKFTFRSEGYSKGVYNSLGFNDREFSLIKPPGVVRIAVLGDSKTEAVQVPRQNNFSKILEKKLNSTANANHHYEVMNCGISSFSTGQEYLLYLDRIAVYKPDVLIVMYNPADNEENTKPFSPRASDIFPRPYFSVSADGKLNIDWSIVDEHMQDLKERLHNGLEVLTIHSRLLAVLERIESNFEQTKLISWFRQLSEVALGPLKTKLALLFPVHESRPKWLSEFNSTYGQEAVACPLTFKLYTISGNLHNLYLNSDASFHVTANILSHLQHACNHNHCRLVVACLPSVNNDLKYFRELQHISELAKTEGFIFIDIHHSFPSLAPMQTADLMFPSWHFMSKAHKIVADVLYKALACKL